MGSKRLSVGLKATLAIFAVAVFVTGTAASQEKVLLNFRHRGGSYSFAGLIFDASGNLYGTTTGGGAGRCDGDVGCGTVFELTPTAGGGWTETVLHSFNENGTDGSTPDAGLALDASGNLYGTTEAGGANGALSEGTVFELTPATGGGWTETVLHSFSKNGRGGYQLHCSPILDGAGNLYGTTAYGGLKGDGTVFEIKH